MTASKIEWTEHTWNPVVGCSVLTPGCTHCYAMAMAARLERMRTAPHYAGTTKQVNGRAVWTGKLALAPAETLLAPLLRKKPTTWFVNSMGDLFHEDCPDDTIDDVFAVMALASQHTMQVLTKRAERMHRYMRTPHRKRIIAENTMKIADMLARLRGHEARPTLDHFSECFAGQGPFRNIWLGVSAERQREAEERIPLLLETPAAVRFLSAEPLLGKIDLMGLIDHPACSRIIDALQGAAGFNAGPDEDGRVMWDGSAPCNKLDWVIAGGESGSGARPMHPDWVRSLRDQCDMNGIPFFFKQWGEWAPYWFQDDGEPKRTHDFGDARMYRIGKANTGGGILDNREHKQFPEAACASSR